MNLTLSKTNLAYLKEFCEGAKAFLCVDTCNQFGSINLKKNGLTVETQLTTGMLGQLKAKGLLSVSRCMIYGVSYDMFKVSSFGKDVFEGRANESN